MYNFVVQSVQCCVISVLNNHCTVWYYAIYVPWYAIMCIITCYILYNDVLYNVQWRVIYCTITCYICYIVYSSVTQCTIACYTVYMSALLSVQKCDMVLCYAVNFNIYLYKLTIIVFIKKTWGYINPGSN